MGRSAIAVSTDALKPLSNIGSSMGKGISTLIQIFNPELIILEGRIAAARQYITIPMLQAINTYCMIQIREKGSGIEKMT